MRPDEHATASRPSASLTIPAELMEHSQWVVWRYGSKQRSDKYAKMPYTPRNGAPASSTNPATWGTFAEALTARESGDYEGVGFVFCATDPYCGIDLDHCRDATSGEIAA